uniref:Copia protein n=1 Tax=Cajanus cajan TaxID=3821 RepID=A0A151SFU9_CAJCA|nr:Copia protein [Cajanus cajan]
MDYVEEIEQHNTDMWFLDSGCSNHMCGKREYFSDLDENFTDLVMLGNNSNIMVNRKANIRLKIDGIISIISGVFYVPELKNNLLSLGQLQEKGLSILFQQGQCKIYHPDKGLIMKANMSANRMFIMHAISLPIASTCFKTAAEDVAHLWHCRFGHLSFKGLQTLQQKEMVKGLPLLKSPSKLCKDCIVGKQHEKSEKWRNAMDVEIEAFEKNGTWELIDRPKGVKIVGEKWVYKTKLNEKGEVVKFKIRLVVKGYAQQYGIDYTEVFAPVARMDTV